MPAFADELRGHREVPLAEEGEDVTEVMRRHGANKTLSLFIGFAIALCSASGSYFAYRQAKVEAKAETSGVRHEAAVGYSTLADPVTLALELGKSCDARVTALEMQVRELKSRQSLPVTVSTPMAPSLGLVPLDRARLYRPLPRTLGEAAAASAASASAPTSADQ
jgi:hypothetical protein